uniref:SET domain-containing protein n=1 Tax=Panagrellus redivivus TaxID=6233 RepID=A0A7E4ULY0_PANRE
MTRKKGTSLPTAPDINSDPKASENPQQLRDASCNNTLLNEAEVVSNKRPSRHAKLRDVAQTTTKSNATTSLVYSALQSTLSPMNATEPSSKDAEGHAAEPFVSGLPDNHEACSSALLNVNAIGLNLELPSTSVNSSGTSQDNLTTVGNVFQSAGLHADTMPVSVQSPMVSDSTANAIVNISGKSPESGEPIPGKQPTCKVKNSNGKNLSSPIQSDLPTKRMKRSSNVKTSATTVPIVSPDSELAVVDDSNAKRKRKADNVMPRPKSNAENYPATPVAMSKAEMTMHPRAVLSVSNASVQGVPIPDTSNVEERDELDKSVNADNTVGSPNLTHRRISKRLMMQDQNRASKSSTPKSLPPAARSIQESALTKSSLEPTAQSLQVNRSESVAPTSILNCNSSAPTPPISGSNSESPQNPLDFPTTVRRMVTRLQSRPPHTQSASDLVSLKSGNSSPNGFDSAPPCFAKSKSVLPPVASPSPPESTTTELSRSRAKSCLSKPNKSTTPAKKSKEREESDDSTPEQLKKRKYWPRNSTSDYNIAKSMRGFRKENDVEKCLLSIQHARHNNGIVKDTYHTDHIQRDVTGNPTETFSEYLRDPKLCVVCKKPKSCKDDRVQKCSYAHPDNPSCKRFVHVACAAQMNFGGYLNFQASTCQGFCCPEHHCTQCFAVGWHKPAFTTDDKLIPCFACASKYHAECLPAGCTVSEDSGKKFIVCPRHYRELMPTHLDKCFECEDSAENKDKPLFKCSTCPKSFHSKCHKVYQYKTGSSFGERCSNCFLHRFALVGDLVVVQFHGSKYHLAEVVHHNVLNPPRSLYPGFCAVKFILERTDPVLYTVSHYNLFFIKERTMFSQKQFLNRMFELRNKTFFRFVHNYVSQLDEPREGIRQYIHPYMIRNSLIKVAERSTCQIGNPRNRTGDRVLEQCDCDTTVDRTRCSFSSCGNHEVQVECLPKCDEKGNCQNRFISKKQGLCDLKQAEVSLTKHGYYGVKTLVDVKKNCFIGEYCGEVISDEHISDSYRYKKIWRSLDCGFYFMRLEEKCIDAEYFGSMVRYMNHSCDPNCEAVIFDSQQGFHVCLFAVKDIKQGEELTFSYTDKKRRDGDTKVKCKCFTEKCLGHFYV